MTFYFMIRGICVKISKGSLTKIILKNDDSKLLEFKHQTMEFKFDFQIENFFEWEKIGLSLSCHTFE